MATLQITGPYPIFTDLDGTPLDDGYLYIGDANDDPETNPQQVYWDANLTIPAAQPIRTSNGYAYRNGSPALIYTSGDFSITIRNKKNEFVLYSPVGYGFDPAAVSASVTKDDFVGDGVATIFELSATPSTQLATSVFINGVYQEKDSYTVVGNVLTFSVAPPLSSSIEVMTNETGVIGTTNANLVSYTAGFVGAVQQTVQSKLEQCVSVKDFGAVGDGVTDDTAAIQAALNSGEYGIFVPNGTYIVDSVTGSDIYLFGSGTIKKKAATKGEMIYFTGDNVVEGITLDYDWTNADQSLPYFANISLRQDQGVITVRDCRFVRSFARALYVEGASLTLLGSSFSAGAPHNNQSGGNERVTSYVDIQADLLTDEQFVEITGNTIVGTSLAAADLHLNPTGILLNAQALDGVRYKSVNIVGNTLIACSQNAGGGNVTGAIDTYNGVENLVVSGNTIRLFSYAGVKIQNSSLFSVTGNVISEGAVPVGAAVAQSQGIITTEKVRGATSEQLNGVVTANVLKDCQYIGINNSCDNVVINGNIIDGVTLATLGNAIFNSASYVTITGNIGRNIEGVFIDTSGGSHVKIIGNTLQSDTVASPGAVSYAGANIDISHNSFVSSIASGGSGVRTNGPASNIRMVGNFVDGYPFGLDFRTTGGAVNNVNVADNQFANITTAPINIGSGVTNAYSDMNTLALVTATYDPPSLAVGNASPVQTTTVTGAAVGDNVVATGVRDMLGLYVVAWVSASDTVSWYVLNPTGNPNGTQDLPNTVFRFRVQKTS